MARYEQAFKNKAVAWMLPPQRERRSWSFSGLTTPTPELGQPDEERWQASTQRDHAGNEQRQCRGGEYAGHQEAARCPDALGIFPPVECADHLDARSSGR